MKHTKTFYFFVAMIVVSVLIIFGAAIMAGFYHSFPETFDPFTLIFIMFLFGFAGVITFSALAGFTSDDRRW